MRLTYIIPIFRGSEISTDIKKQQSDKEDIAAKPFPGQTELERQLRAEGGACRVSKQLG